MVKSIDPIEILLRNRSALQAERPLLIDPPDSGTGRRLSSELDWPRVDILARDFRVYRPLKQLSDTPGISFGLIGADPGRCDLALIFMPRGKRLLHMTIAWLASAMPDGARIMAVGRKRSGIASAEGMLKEVAERVRRVDSARHSVLLSGVVGGARREFNQERWMKVYSLRTAERNLRIASFPGVFSDGRLDDGTERLLHHLDPGRPDLALDLGCGQGVIGAALAIRFPSTRVHLTDVHAAALVSARKTLELNELANCTVVASDVYREISDRYDLIVTNPPFHQGGETERATVEAMIAEASDHLHEDGSLQLVANRFLPYQRDLSRYFAHVAVLHEDNRFRVWKASRPRVRG